MKHFYILSIIMILPISSLAQTQNSWTKKQRFAGGKRERAVGFAIGDYGYIATGEDSASWTHNDLWRYDPVSDSWTEMASIPGPARRNAIGVTIGNYGYVGMGIDSSNSFTGTIHSDWWQYDPVANSWLQKANYPGGYNIYNQTNVSEGIYYATAFSIGSKGYVCGGKMGSDFYATDLWEYDPSLDAWTRKADFPGGDRYQLSSFAVNGYGYVGMGVDHDLFRKDWWEYDPNLNVWSQVSNLPGNERGAAQTFVLGEYGFLVFGGEGGYYDELWQYNPFSDSWNIKANFPGGERKNGVAFAIGDSAYAGTGKGLTGLRKNFYSYYPSQPVGIKEQTDPELTIYPNPIKDVGYILSDDYNLFTHYVILNIQGQVVERQFISGPQTLIEGKNMNAGTYILLAFNEKNEILSKQKIIFQ